MRRSFRSAVLLLLFLGPTAQLWAQLPKAQRKEAKAYLSGTLYMRIDAPCGTGRHPMGTYMFPLVEVSPDGVSTEGDTGFSAGWYHAQSTYWGVGPNDTLQFDEMEFDEDTAEIELTGIGRTDGNDTVIKFIKIHSLDDFKKAADRAFSRVPLQDEHADWSPEIKKAIADRQLMKGMTKRQVFYVTGNPESVRESEEKGKKVEVWTMRQNKGMKVGFWTVSAAAPSAGVPKTLRFVDGKLEEHDATRSGGVDLDN
ncbi:MAG TPA: hypothetical protein VF756_07210 [Thermoanaerobaculia bacterium]